VGRDGKQSGGEKKGRKKEESKGKREDRLDWTGIEWREKEGKWRENERLKEGKRNAGRRFSDTLSPPDSCLLMVVRCILPWIKTVSLRKLLKKKIPKAELSKKKFNGLLSSIFSC
jgi:hypothetical protein